MGISANYAYRLQSELTSHIKELMCQARHFHYTNEDISAGMLNLRTSNAWRRAPRHVHAYCEGVYQTLRDDLYHNHLMWVLSLDGKLMTSKEVDALTLTEKERIIPTSDGWGVKVNPDYKSPWSRINSDMSRLVWKDNKGLPMYDKPFDARFLVK